MPEIRVEPIVSLPKVTNEVNLYNLFLIYILLRLVNTTLIAFDSLEGVIFVFWNWYLRKPDDHPVESSGCRNRESMLHCYFLLACILRGLWEACYFGPSPTKHLYWSWSWRIRKARIWTHEAWLLVRKCKLISSLVVLPLCRFVGHTCKMNYLPVDLLILTGTNSRSCFSFFHAKIWRGGRIKILKYVAVPVAKRRYCPVDVYLSDKKQLLDRNKYGPGNKLLDLWPPKKIEWQKSRIGWQVSLCTRSIKQIIERGAVLYRVIPYYTTWYNTALPYGVK